MVKERLKVAFVDFWPEWKDEDFITPILETQYELIEDRQNPDVVFHSVFGRQADGYDCRKVLFLGENKRPGAYNTTYSISFDPVTETNFRLPLWQVFLLRKPSLMDSLFERFRHPKFDEFCSFTVSNPANFIRNSVFQQLNSYKMVKSYGRYLTNSHELQEASRDRYWRDAKEEFFRSRAHKFCIAYENNPYRYYCTEKLMDAFLGGSMPIYWGDPRVAEDWNEKAFINATRMSDVASEVKRLDRSDALFMERYAQPVFTDEQRERHINTLGEFKSWLLKIVR